MDKGKEERSESTDCTGPTEDGALSIFSSDANESIMHQGAMCCIQDRTGQAVYIYLLYGS